MSAIDKLKQIALKEKPENKGKKYEVEPIKDQLINNFLMSPSEYYVCMKDKFDEFFSNINSKYDVLERIKKTRDIFLDDSNNPVKIPYIINILHQNDYLKKLSPNDLRFVMNLSDNYNKVGKYFYGLKPFEDQNHFAKWYFINHERFLIKQNQCINIEHLIFFLNIEGLLEYPMEELKNIIKACNFIAFKKALLLEKIDYMKEVFESNGKQVRRVDVLNHFDDLYSKNDGIWKLINNSKKSVSKKQKNYILQYLNFLLTEF